MELLSHQPQFSRCLGFGNISTKTGVQISHLLNSQIPTVLVKVRRWTVRRTGCSSYLTTCYGSNISNELINFQTQHLLLTVCIYFLAKSRSLLSANSSPVIPQQYSVVSSVVLPFKREAWAVLCKLSWITCCCFLEQTKKAILIPPYPSRAPGEIPLHVHHGTSWVHGFVHLKCSMCELKSIPFSHSSSVHF